MIGSCLIENQGGDWAATAVERRAAILQGEISTLRVLTFLEVGWEINIYKASASITSHIV